MTSQLCHVLTSPSLCQQIAPKTRNRNFSKVELWGWLTPLILMFIRDVSRRIDSEESTEVHLPRSIEQITGRVGRLPLKQLVRESTDVIEALCIEAALKLTQDNRAAAAELLGLSRQSLYTKLRRFDIGDSEDNVV